MSRTVDPFLEQFNIVYLALFSLQTVCLLVKNYTKRKRSRSLHHKLLLKIKIQTAKKDVFRFFSCSSPILCTLQGHTTHQPRELGKKIFRLDTVHFMFAILPSDFHCVCSIRLA